MSGIGALRDPGTEHVVQDLQFEVDFDSEELAFDLQERMQSLLKSDAMRLLGEVFDEIVPAPRVLRLERLEIDLGEVDAGELESQWLDRLRDRLGEQLRRALSEHGEADPSRAGAAAASQRGDVHDEAFRSLAHFLRHGTLPWHAGARTDLAALAQRVGQHRGEALLSLLRRWPDVATLVRRMVRQLPGDWCAAVEAGLSANPVPRPVAPGPWPHSEPEAEARLLRALKASATPPAPGPRARPVQSQAQDQVQGPLARGASLDAASLQSGTRAAHRRFRALLADDAPDLSADDLAELLQLWQRLHKEDPEGLRRGLESMGRLTRVRRRIAHLWPESLLQSVARLGLGGATIASGPLAAKALAPPAVREGAVAARRHRWESLLRQLWVGGAAGRHEARTLLSALEAPVAFALRASTGRAEGASPLPSRPPPAAWSVDTGRRPAGPARARTWMGRRRHAATMTETSLADELVSRLPASDAAALASLAFGPLPQCWQRDDTPMPPPARLCEWMLALLHERRDEVLAAGRLADHWARAIALDLRRSPHDLWAALQVASDDGTEAARQRAWLRWLPASPPPPPRVPAASPANVDASGPDPELATEQPEAGALHDLDAAGVNALVARLDERSWQKLLSRFLPEVEAARAADLLQGLNLELRATAGEEAARTFLRETALLFLLWQPGLGAAALGRHLVEEVARRCGSPGPALARRLSVDLRRWLAPAGRDSTGPMPDPAAGPARTPIAMPAVGRADSEAVARVIAALRGTAPMGDLAGAERTLLLALAERGAPVAREAVARELESARSAQRLADALPPGELLRVVAWLRPADALPLAPLWTALQARAEAIGPGAWPRVARIVLRELFEEDRPLMPAALLHRVERDGQRPVGAPHAPLPEPADRAEPWLVEPMDETLFVANAGIVLVAPYLPRLFEILGLVAGKRFVDVPAAERAVALIQHAVAARAEAAEPDLVLNKLLCGLPLGTAVPREVHLSARDTEAVDSLLLAAIGHWKALGRTSLAGLRQTFLQREGRLEHKQDAWHLEVQPQTFDMLIDRLPWGFATVRFPWMPEVLHVHWR